MLKAVVSIAVVAGAIAAVPAYADATHHQGTRGVAAQLSREDKDFLNDAAMGGLYEVKLGEIIAKQSANADVKHFAQRMVDDHAKVNAQLEQVAKQQGLALPQQLDKKHQDQIDKLSKEGGPDLDRDYMDQMVDDHKDDIKAFQHEAKEGKDPALRQLATTTLPVLEEHLALARQTQERIKK